MRDPDTLSACLELAASRDGLGVRFVGRHDEPHYTYREIAERALEVAGALRTLGVEPSDRVAIAVPSSLAFYEVFFGALFAGAVPAVFPQPRRLGSRSDYTRAATAMIRACGARIAIASERAQAAIPQDVTELGVVALRELRRCPTAPVPVAPTDLALVQFTSGTTGTAKPIGLTHQQILANVRALLEELVKAYPEENGFEHSAVSWLPLYHDMGLVGALLTSLARPGPLTLMTPELFVARPARWLQMISKHRASVSAAPHFAYGLCVDRVRDDELEGVDLSSWLLALDGAESVTPRTLERFLARFRPYGLREDALTPAYGLAEAGLAVTCSSIRGSYRTRDFEGRNLVSAGTLMTPELFVARPARWLQMISKHRASVSAAPHFAYGLCVDRVRDDELEGVDLSSWLLALDGAESVTPKTLERFLARFRPYGLREDALTPAYGLAEAGLAVTCSSIRGSYRTRDFEGRKLVSAGRPLGDFRVRILGGSGGVGKVLVAGPSLMTGYLGMEDATRRVLKDGWLDTGDEGFLEDGELFLTGRNRDMIVLRGTNYAPEHFEEIVASLEGIGNVAAVAVVTERGDELCILAEVTAQSRDASSDWAQAAIKDILSARAGIVPHRVRLLDPGSLPRTSSGKLRRGEAAHRFAR